MSVVEDPCKALLIEEESIEFDTLSDRPVSASPEPVARVLPATATVRLHGFDLEERPLVVGLPGMPYEVVTARTTVHVALSMMNGGSSTVNFFATFSSFNRACS